jgi:hypothetical protein
MNSGGFVGMQAGLASAAKTSEINMNEYTVDMECRSLGISGHKLNLILFYLHSTLHIDITQS